MKKRNIFWDNYKGILVFLVVFGHFISSYATNLPESLAAKVYIFIYSFHMPAFTFCSGYFSKSERSRSTESLTNFFLYYVVFNTMMLLLAYFYLDSSIKFLTPYLSYWYLISLITWRFLVAKLSKVKGIILISIVLSLALGYNKEITDVLSLRRTVAFFPFFVAGYKLDMQRFEDFLRCRKRWHLAAALVLCFVASAVAFWAVNQFGVTPNSTYMFSYNKEAGIFQRILIFTVSFFAILCMCLTIPNCNVPFLSKIGKNSLLIYLVHRFVTIIYYQEWFPYKTYTRFYLVYALIFTFFLCYLLGCERINRFFLNTCDSCTKALTSQESRTGTLIITVIIYAFLCLLLFDAAQKMSNDFNAATKKQEGSVVVQEMPVAKSEFDGYLRFSPYTTQLEDATLSPNVFFREHLM